MEMNFPDLSVLQIKHMLCDEKTDLHKQAKGRRRS